MPTSRNVLFAAAMAVVGLASIDLAYSATAEAPKTQPAAPAAAGGTPAPATNPGDTNGAGGAADPFNYACNDSDMTRLQSAIDKMPDQTKRDRMAKEYAMAKEMMMKKDDAGCMGHMKTMSGMM